jgi:hypothetical protein
VRINPAAAAAMKNQISCPDKLASYVAKSFQKCLNETERAFMEEVLGRICEVSKTKGTLFQKDWDALPLPNLSRESKNPLNNI